MSTSPDYGTAVSCLLDLDPYGALVSGQEAVAQSGGRMLTCPQGQLITDRERGYDVRDLLLRAGTSATDQVAISLMEAECLRDERVDEASVTITREEETDGEVTVQVDLETGDGPFSLVFTLSDTTVTLTYP